jgi:hypothetical protein
MYNYNNIFLDFIIFIGLKCTRSTLVYYFFFKIVFNRVRFEETDLKFCGSDKCPFLPRPSMLMFIIDPCTLTLPFKKTFCGRCFIVLLKNKIK